MQTHYENEVKLCKEKYNKSNKSSISLNSSVRKIYITWIVFHKESKNFLFAYTKFLHQETKPCDGLENKANYMFY